MLNRSAEDHPTRASKISMQCISALDLSDARLEFLPYSNDSIQILIPDFASILGGSERTRSIHGIADLATVHRRASKHFHCLLDVKVNFFLW